MSSPKSFTSKRQHRRTVRRTVLTGRLHIYTLLLGHTLTHTHTLAPSLTGAAHVVGGVVRQQFSGLLPAGCAVCVCGEAGFCLINRLQHRAQPRHCRPQEHASVSQLQNVHTHRHARTPTNTATRSSDPARLTHRTTPRQVRHASQHLTVDKPRHLKKSLLLNCT